MQIDGADGAGDISNLGTPAFSICKYFVPACTHLLDSCLDKNGSNVQVMSGIQNLTKVIKDICNGEEMASVVLMTSASRVLPALMRQVASHYGKITQRQVVNAVQRLAWKLEAGLLSHNQVVDVHSLIFSDGRRDAFSWAMLSPPPSLLPLTKCASDKLKAAICDVSPKHKSEVSKRAFSFDFFPAVSAESLRSLLGDQLPIPNDDAESVKPNGDVHKDEDELQNISFNPSRLGLRTLASDPGFCERRCSDDVFITQSQSGDPLPVLLRRRGTYSSKGSRQSSTERFYSKMKNTLRRQSSIMTLSDLLGDVPSEILTSGSNINEILERNAYQGKLPPPDLLDEFKMLSGRKPFKSSSMNRGRDLPIDEESDQSEQSEASSQSTPERPDLSLLDYDENPSSTPTVDGYADTSPSINRRRMSRFKSISVRLSKIALRLNFGRQESTGSNRSSASSVDNLLEATEKFAYVSVNSIRRRKSNVVSAAEPSTSHRWFEITLKTNLDEYESNFCRAYKRFRDVMDLYDAIAEAHGSAQLPPKLSKSVMSTSSSVSAQIEQHLKAILSTPELRSCHELVEFFGIDVTEESEESDRHLLVSFFTPFAFGSKDSTRNWPKIVDLPGRAHSPIARKVMNRMTVRHPTHRSAEESNMDQHHCIVVREDSKRVMVLVWDEVTDTHVVAAGTVEHLVEHLANEDRPDPGYVKTFLMGYRHFMEAEDLIDRLLTRFNVGLPEESTDEEKEYVEKWGVVVQLRTVDVLTQWMERCWFDFHGKQAMLTRVDEFIEELRSSSDNEVFKSLAESLKKVKDRKIEEETKMRLEAAKLVKPLEPSPLTFDDFTAQQLAKQLTLTELSYLKAIEPTEFIRQLWDKHPGTREERKRALTPNIAQYVEFFNRVCFWVGTEVLSYQDVKIRAACVEKMTEISRLCRSYNNFNTSMAIMTGLNYSAVGARRLKQTWEHVSVRSRTTLEDIEELFSSESNFITYRRLQGSLKRTAPCIPFFGLYSKDFVFINDGNPKHLANGLVNFSKLRMVMHRVSDLEWYQHSRFQFASEVNADHMHYCKTLRALCDEELYERSLLVEPKVRSTPSDESSRPAGE